MNKKTVSQIDLFFSSLLSRMLENKSYFTNITIEFKSGTKLFPAVITLENDSPALDYQAVKRGFGDTDEIKAFILSEASKYDEAKIIYTERGARIVVSATEKGVKMSHEDVSAPAPEKPAAKSDKRSAVRCKSRACIGFAFGNRNTCKKRQNQKRQDTQVQSD